MQYCARENELSFDPIFFSCCTLVWDFFYFDFSSLVISLSLSVFDELFSRKNAFFFSGLEVWYILLFFHLLQDSPSAASQLAVSVIHSCAEKLEPFVCGFLTSCFLDRDAVDGDLKEFYHEIVFKIFQCSPQMLLAVIPNLIQELLVSLPYLCFHSLLLSH